MTIQGVSTDTQAQIASICQALEDKKALDIKILDVSEKSSITDFFIIASGNSIPHLRALCSSVEVVLKEQGTGIVGVDREPHSGWVVIDGFDFMVHIFLPDMRDSYSLDVLWKDAEEVELDEISA